MSNVDSFIAKGAQIVGGDLILRHKVMGSFRHGDFVLSAEGLAEMEVIDVVEVKEARKPRAKKVESDAATTDELSIEA